MTNEKYKWEKDLQLVNTVRTLQYMLNYIVEILFLFEKYISMYV